MPVVTVQSGLPRRHVLIARQHAERGRLPSAVHPEEAETLTCGKKKNHLLLALSLFFPQKDTLLDGEA